MSWSYEGGRHHNTVVGDLVAGRPVVGDLVDPAGDLEEMGGTAAEEVRRGLRGGGG